MVKCQTRRCDPVPGRILFRRVDWGFGHTRPSLLRLIVPRISHRANPARAVGAVNQAQVDQVLASVQAVKAAAEQHRARFGSLASRNGTPFDVAGKL